MKPKKTISAYILTVGMLTLLATGSLVAFQIYSALTKSQISRVQERAIKPLDGSIKVKVVENLEQRKWFNRNELDKVIILNIPTTGNPPIATETGKVKEE